MPRRRRHCSRNESSAIVWRRLVYFHLASLRRGRRIDLRRLASRALPVALALPPRRALAPRAFVQRSSPPFPSQTNRALERRGVHDFALLRDLEEVHRGRASRDLPRGVHVFPPRVRDAAHHLLETFASRRLRGSHGLALSALVKDLEDDGQQSLARRGRSGRSGELLASGWDERGFGDARRNLTA